MAIDVRLPASPSSVRAVADWLRAVERAASKARSELGLVAGDGRYHWRGEAGRAWFDAVHVVISRSEDLPGFLSDAVEVFRAYANRLENIQEHFAELRFQAGEVGLTVVGATVYPPVTTLDYCPGPGSPDADLEEYEDYTRKIASYRDLEEKVGTSMGTLDAWIGEKIVPLVARVKDLASLSDTVKALAGKGNAELPGVGLDAYEKYVDENLSRWRMRHDELQDAADEFRRQLRSGNPALKAAAEAADPRAMRRSIAEIAEQIENVSKLAKTIPVGGKIIDIVSIANDLANGESPSSLLAELGGEAIGGVGGGLAGAGLASALSLNPIGLTAIGIGLGTLAVGAGTRYVYEANVPLDVRETIDGFFKGSKPRLEGYIPPTSRAYRPR